MQEPFSFDRVYGAWWQRIVHGHGAAAVRRSADRYLSFALDDEPPGDSQGRDGAAGT